MPLREDLLLPISEENPTGVPINADPAYDKLRELRKPNEKALREFLEPRKPNEPRRKMTRDIWMPQDTGKVIQLSSEVLAKKSKDLEIAVWLVEALTWRDGFAGLRDGLTLVLGLLENFWDTLHPQPEEPGDYGLRLRHIEWMANYLEMTKGSSPTLALGFVPMTQNGLLYYQYKESRAIPLEKEASGDKAKKDRKEAIADGKLTPEEFDKAFNETGKPFYKTGLATVKECAELVQKLDTYCTEKFAGDPPAFTQLRETLEQIQNGFEILLARKLLTDPDPVEVAPEPEAAEGEQVQEAAGSGAPKSSGPSEIDDMIAQAGGLNGIEPASPQEAIVRIIAAARYLRKRDPANPHSYLILRGLRWGELRAGGAEINPAQLNAPSSEVRSRIRTLAQQGKWADVLDAAENAMATECGRGWLDLQRYSIRACSELGHSSAAKAMRAELARLLADYPALQTMTLLDDTGTANPDTIAWLAANMGQK